MYVNNIGNRITFKTKAGYYLELLTPGTMKLPGSTNNKITKKEHGAKVLYLEITEAVFVHHNIDINDYHYDLRVLHTFVPNESFVQLLDISSKFFIFLKAFNLEFSYIEESFTSQNFEGRR